MSNEPFNPTERNSYVWEWMLKNAYKGDCGPKMAWVDVETTGLRPTEDYLLEVAIIITDEMGLVIDATETLVVDQWIPPNTLELGPEVVRKMHTRSGLWTEIMAPRAHETWSVEEAKVEIGRFLDSNLGDAKFPMSGSTVSFDRSWMQEYFPVETAKHFTHRHIDVSTLLELAKLHDPEWYDLCVKEVKARNYHRGMADLIDTIETYRFWLAHPMKI